MLRMHRRDFLRVSGLTAGAGLLSACTAVPDDEPDPTPEPSPSPEIDEEATATPAPDPTPTPEPEPTPTSTPQVEPFDVLILGGEVIDGTGEERYAADVGIQGDRIAAFGDLREYSAEVTIDAAGLFVAPGFINTHSHADQWIDEGYDLTPSLLQGCTSEIAGDDGDSAVDIEDQLERFEETALEVNVGTKIGHGAVREAVMGDSQERPDDAQLDEMRALIDAGLAAGAFGISSGLEYTPGAYAEPDEIHNLAEVAEEHESLYTTHMRDEGRQVIEAVDEALDVGRQSGVTVIITHIKVRRVPGWPDDPQQLLDLTDQVIGMIEEAREDGLDVWTDLYPYTSTWGNIEQPLSQVAGQHPPEIMILSWADESEWLDWRISELADEWGIQAGEAIERILADSPDARVSLEGMHPDSVRQFLQMPTSMVTIDNAVPTLQWDHAVDEIVHPRVYGTYPRLLGQYVREEGLLSWEEAVYRSTGLPARVFDVQERGYLRERYYADLVLFDPETVRDRTTPAHPDRHPEGIEYVLVNGEVAVADGELVPEDHGHVTAGRALRRTT